MEGNVVQLCSCLVKVTLRSSLGLDIGKVLYLSSWSGNISHE